MGAISDKSFKTICLEVCVKIKVSAVLLPLLFGSSAFALDRVPVISLSAPITMFETADDNSASVDLPADDRSILVMEDVTNGFAKAHLIDSEGVVRQGFVLEAAFRGKIRPCFPRNSHDICHRRHRHRIGLG